MKTNYIALTLLLAIGVLSIESVYAQTLVQGELNCPRVLANTTGNEYSLSTNTRCFRSKRAAERAGFKAGAATPNASSGISGTWALRLIPRGTSCSELAGPTSIDIQISRKGSDLFATLPDGRTLNGFSLNNSVIFGLNESIACSTDTDGTAQSLTSIELTRPAKDSLSFGRALYRFAQNCDHRCSDNFIGVAERK